MSTFKVGDRVEARLGVPQDLHTPFLIGGTISEVAHNINGQVVIAWVDWDNGRKTGYMKPQTQLIRIEKEEPAMTDRKNHLANLKAIRSNVDLAIERVEKEIESERSLIRGQVWKNATGMHYIVTMIGEKFVLVSLGDGNIWSLHNGFNGKGSLFTYVGMAEDAIGVVSE